MRPCRPPLNVGFASMPQGSLSELREELAGVQRGQMAFWGSAVDRKARDNSAASSARLLW